MTALRYVWLAVLIAGAPLGNSANAATLFDFSFSASNGNITVSGMGVFTSGSTSSPYTLTGVSGTASDSSYNSGIPSSITGLDFSFQGPDNLLYYPNQPYVDSAGISFDTVDGNMYNIFHNLFPSDYVVDTLNEGVGGVTFTVSQVSTTPLPAALPLFGAGLAGLGWLVRRRKA